MADKFWWIVILIFFLQDWTEAKPFMLKAKKEISVCVFRTFTVISRSRFVLSIKYAITI